MNISKGSLEALNDYQLTKLIGDIIEIKLKRMQAGTPNAVSPILGKTISCVDCKTEFIITNNGFRCKHCTALIVEKQQH